MKVVSDKLNKITKTKANITEDHVMTKFWWTLNKSVKSRQGKGSRNQNQDKFRRRKGAQEVDALRKRIESNFSMFSKDTDEQLKTAVNAVQLTPQKRAVPLEVTTRGVGFATAISYERTCTTWSLNAITRNKIFFLLIWFLKSSQLPKNC